MSALAEAPARDRSDVRDLPGEVGMVERPRSRFLPFDAWHLFLAPLAVVMLLPLVWMVATSLETEQQTLHFPPILWPGIPRFGNYLDVLRDSLAELPPYAQQLSRGYPAIPTWMDPDPS